MIDWFSVAIVGFVVLFFGGLFWTIFFKNPRTLNSIQLNLTHATSPHEIMSLSTYPFLLWFERFFITPCSLWFNDDFIYIFDKNELIGRYKFEEILELKKLNLRINSYAIWQIKFRNLDEKLGEKSYKFAPLNSLMRPNFRTFLTILKEKNIDIIN